MTGNISIPSSTSGKNNTNYISSIFACSKFFVGFSSKSFSDSETAMNSTSIADTNNPFFSGRIGKRVPFFRNGDSGGIGLAIVDSLSKENSEKRSSNQSTRMVLLGSRLKIKIPSLQPNSTYPTGSVESPRTPIEFGVKNKDSKLALHSPAGLMPKLFMGSITPREMELSEDYTCVISYGPNPKKIHIFDNYVVESCGHGFAASRRKEAGFSDDDQRSWGSSEDFLSFCHGCRKSLGQGKDIFMYRGERAFCSDECRQIEMMSDDSRELIENCFENLPDHLK